MAGIKIEGGSGIANSPNVDANYNLQVNLPMTDSQAGYVTILSEGDAGTINGSRHMRALEVTDDFRLRVGQDNMVFNETFVGSAINTGLWNNSLTVTALTTAPVSGDTFTIT